MRVTTQQGRQRGFALPAVLIASVVMLSVLSIAVTSVAAVRTALKSQYYEQLAKTAGEAGVAYAKACLAKNGNVPLWTNDRPLGPHTDCAGNPLLQPEVQVLAVAGGGGGANNHGGGGGGGGVAYNGALPVATGNSFAITVGAGGAGGVAVGAAGATGSDSRFGTVITALGGGGGGGRINTDVVSQPTTKAGGVGSGGGGAGTTDGAVGSGAVGGVGTAGQGFRGGNGSSTIGGAGNGGGGGGATAIGTAGTGTASGVGSSGAGGNGYGSDISGSMVYYGGGGSGGRWGAGTVGAAGLSGGGRGGNNDGAVGADGVPNTGGGGGGGGGAAANGGAGGSGIVIVRYSANGSIGASVTGADVTSGTMGPYRTHVFRANGSFVVNTVSASTCPQDHRCSVAWSEDMRSSFRVPAPTVDDQGKAVAIANSGYVELLRKSNKSVWRKYTQPSVQAAVVPDLCSGSATSALGWSNAVPALIRDSIPSAGSATTITLPGSDPAQNLVAGQMYFRRDFPITTQGSYTVSGLTSNAQDHVELFIDGVSKVISQGSLASASVDLSPGCHTVTARLTNKTVQPRPSKFTAAVQATTSGSAPIVATDSSWRASAGVPVGFTSSEFYADPSIWGGVSNLAIARTANPVWTVDTFTPMISTSTAGCPGACPPSATAYLRDSKDFQLTEETELLVSALCDDDCEVYIGSRRVISSSIWATQVQNTVILPAGTYRLGVKLYNSGGAGNPAGAAVNVNKRDSNGALGEVVARTDLTWKSTNFWTPGPAGMIESFESSFRPSPDEIPRGVTIDALLIGGGGGGGLNSGGGGGGGGVQYIQDIPASIGTYNVVVGTGGAVAPNVTTRGTNGNISTFMGYTARGGGAGASRDGGLAASVAGATGGGGAGATVALRVPGAIGVPGQGGSGGDGTVADQGGLAKGGGGGGNTASNGSQGLATDGGGSAAGVATAWRAGGGSGAANGGAGSAGGVLVRFKTGTMTVSATGGYTTFTTNVNGTSYTGYHFTGAGTFRIISLN